VSKIGRKPIDLAGVTVNVDGLAVTVKGPKGEFSHELPASLSAVVVDNKLAIKLENDTRKNRMVWGLHRALLANKVIGASKGFEQVVKLVGLGYKGVLSGNKVTFTVGYSHKVDYVLPEGVSVDIDKSGQTITVKTTDKFVLGNVCDAMRSIRPPEPYKGTGIMREGEVIIRKAGKTK
jgi:large subunit ribosomal protein L6